MLASYYVICTVFSCSVSNLALGISLAYLKMHKTTLNEFESELEYLESSTVFVNKQKCAFPHTYFQCLSLAEQWRTLHSWMMNLLRVN